MRRRHPRDEPGGAKAAGRAKRGRRVQQRLGVGDGGPKASFSQQLSRAARERRQHSSSDDSDDGSA
jgi:hypothetical protein